MLGAGITGAALYYLPLVDQARETSIVSVTPNGGNRESFHANLPEDRIMIGAPDAQATLPAGLDWPGDDLLGATRAELFKIRNAEDTVVGVASRIAAYRNGNQVVEWVYHLPARGSAYVLMRPQGAGRAERVGDLRAGSREFEGHVGEVTERWTIGPDDAADGRSGKVELRTFLVANSEDAS